MVFVMLLASLFAIGCDGSGDPVDPPPGSEQGEGGTGGSEGGGNSGGGVQRGYKYVSILADRKFERGLKVRGLGVPIYNDPVETFGAPQNPSPACYFQYGKDIGEMPYWNLCQWSTRYPFHDVNNTTDTFNYRFTENKDGYEYLYENRSKVVGVSPSTGDFRLYLKASECYKSPRENGQEWPHLLLEYKHEDDVTNQMTVSKMKNLKVTVDMTLNSFVNHMGEYKTYPEVPNKNLHASICMFYLFVNRIPEGSDTFTDEMIWLGMTLFDNRTPINKGMDNMDSGTKPTATDKFIYNVNAEYYLSADNNVWENGQMVMGKTASINFDILPHISKALESAQSIQYMEDAKLDELYITGMYIGFENTGTYDIDMSFSNMDVKSNIYTRL